MYLFFHWTSKATLMLWLAYAAYSAVHLWSLGNAASAPGAGTGGAPRPYERSSLLVRSKAGRVPAAQTFTRALAKRVW